MSEADRAAERAIRAVLGASRPGDAILGEEGGETQEGAGLRWIVDPLDGTVNFLYGIPHWCVSVAVHDDAGGVAGVVYDPLREELFAGCRGGGLPTCNGAVRGSSPGRPDPGANRHRLRLRPGGAHRAGRGGCAAAGAGARRAPDGQRGAGLAWTAAGRYDAFYERGVQLWDIAAGSVLCEVAGLTVRPLAADDARPGGVMAAPAALLDALAAIVE